MRKMKKIILGCMAFACVAFAGAGAALETSVADAAEVAYQYVDTAMYVKFSNQNKEAGEFNVSVILPEYDYTGTPNDWYAFGSLDVAPIFEELGFFDNILIGEKTLREWGCTSFFVNSIGYGAGEPQNQMTFHCQADPVLWNEALASGELKIPTYDSATNTISEGSAVTVKEGTLIPGYTGLISNGIVYRASATYIGRPGQFDYSWYTVGQTDIDSIKYVTDWDENYQNAYLGISLEGDDYLGDGSVEEINQNMKHPFNANPNMFVNNILVNGEEEKVQFYGLYNHGNGGEGHFSLSIKVKKEDCVTITIPKGTLFPSRATNELRKLNAAFPHVWFATQTDKTFYMMNGELLTYADFAVSELKDYKSDYGYFRTDEAEQRAQIIEVATTAIKAAATEDDAKVLLEKAKADIDALKTAAQYADEELAVDKAAARSEVENYLSDVTYFAEQAAERLAAIETGLTGIASAKNIQEINSAVANAKETIDALQTRATIAEAAKAELDAYKADVEYRAQEQEIRVNAIALAKAAIDSSATQADVIEAVAAAKATIDELKSAEEYLDQTLETKRQETLAAVNAEKAKIDYDWYAEADHTAINELYYQAKATIAIAETEEEMTAALQTFKAEIAKLDKREPKKDEVEKGCMASIGSASVVFGVMAMLGVVLVKRKEK